MTLLSKIGQYSFLAEPFKCDFSGRIFLGHLGNAMLNAAEFHSDERGFGMSFLNSTGLTWVLSRFAIEVYSLPKAYSNFIVETWVDDVMKYFTSRNFEVKDSEGHTLGYGRSIWAMIDASLRTPVEIAVIRNGLISEYIERDKQCPVSPASRVKAVASADKVGSLTAKYSDVDVNGHVNSMKYLEHILDTWSPDWFARHDIKRCEIAYVAEAHCGDDISIYREQVADKEWLVKVTKTDGTKTQSEVCRSRIVFEGK